MGYIAGIARAQLILFPESLDDYIAADNPVRFISAWVDSLDLATTGFTGIVPAETGRPGYDPRALLKLYIYGYLNRIRSSRKLEQECGRNVEVMWLLGKLAPDHKTIANFRKDNLAAFKELFKAFCLLCRELGLFGGELIAVDGSKFKAVNRAKRNFTLTRVKEYLVEMEERLAAYLLELDQADQGENAVGCAKGSAAEWQAKIERLKSRRDKYQGYLNRMAESGDSQLSLTDPDSRAMPQSPQAAVAYNVQSVVASQHHLIVAQDVSNDITDHAQLSRMTIAGKQMLTVETVKAVADAGQAHGKELKACQAAGIEVYVPRPDTSVNTRLGLFGKVQFVYDPAVDTCTCPAGETLTFRFETIEKARQIRYYKTSACSQCPVKEKCTRNKEGRRITRWIDEHSIEETQVRVKADPETMKKRGQLVEHPFGTIKFWWDHSHFLMKGLEKVKAEFSLSTLAYNLRRVLNILGVERLMAALS
jgi:transposase